MTDVPVAQQREWLTAWVVRHTGTTPILRETHVSILAFAGDQVWKCKKAVRFPFIDLSTAARRLENGEREVLLNRRLAPDVYLGVVALDDAQGAVLDHLVEMRRLPESRRLSAVVAHDANDAQACIDALADLLVQFHARAGTGGDIDRAASPAALTELWTGSFEELRPFAGAVLDAGVYQQVTRDALAYLRGRTVLFEQRIAAGRIRDGHGDLLADDVFCLPEGPRVLDCLEFDERLRFGDVLADVAFLAMDLERLDHHHLARRFLDRYRAGTGDDWPASLADFYIAYRALVRTKVACLRVADDPDAAATAEHLLGLAADHLARARVRLVLVGGPPATGKTTVARALARVTGWPVLRSDEVRKELAGVAPTTDAAAPVDRGLYTGAWSDRTYATLLARARVLLEGGHSVILDASWSTDERRAQADALASETAGESTSFVCDVPAATADERARDRALAGDDASDATPAVAAALRARFAPWPGAEVLDTTDPADAVASRMHARLGPTSRP